MSHDSSTPIADRSYGLTPVTSVKAALHLSRRRIADRDSSTRPRSVSSSYPSLAGAEQSRKAGHERARDCLGAPQLDVVPLRFQCVRLRVQRLEGLFLVHTKLINLYAPSAALSRSKMEGEADDYARCKTLAWLNCGV